MARLGPRASFQTASSLGSEVDSQVQGATVASDVRVDTFTAVGPFACRRPKATAVLNPLSPPKKQVEFISLALERPNSPSSGTALSTHCETQVCNVQLLDEEDIYFRVNLRDAEMRPIPMLVTRSTETQTDCFDAGTRTEATQTELEAWSPLAEVTTATADPCGFAESGDAAAGCVAFPDEAEEIFTKVEAEPGEEAEGWDGSPGSDGLRADEDEVTVAENVEADDGPSPDDMLVQTSLVTHMEETMLAHDAAAQAALAGHVEESTEAREIVRTAALEHVEETRRDREEEELRLQRPSSQLTLSDAEAPMGLPAPEEPSEAEAEADVTDVMEAHNREIAPQADTQDEELEAWRLRVQLMMLQEAAASCIPAKMSPRELVRTLGMAMADSPSFAQASPEDVTHPSSRGSLLAEGLMTPPSPPAPSSARSRPSEASGVPLRCSALFDDKEFSPKKVHPVPPLDFSRVYMGDADTDFGDYEGADSTWMTHGRSLTPTTSSSSRLSKSTSDGRLLQASVFSCAPADLQAQASPEEKYRRFVGKIRAKHLLPPRTSPFAKPQVLAPITYKAGGAFGNKAKKVAARALPATPFMEQLHSHFHHHFHFRNNLPPISHSVDFETGASTDSF
ncbi:unnamed protein product [Symbiodinium sp. CCMP2592]|nr:unnamed protein product [Symbiodinium sp. CCMP2592]